MQNYSDLNQASLDSGKPYIDLEVTDEYILRQFDENIDPATEEEAFGSTLSLNDDGSKIAIGAQLSNANGIYNGAVYVYKLTNGTYVQDQILLAPNGEVTCEKVEAAGTQFNALMIEVYVFDK